MAGTNFSDALCSFGTGLISMDYREILSRSAAMTRTFAIVTGASTGIGLELARCCAKDGYDLLIAAESAIESAAS
jgi:hypothetical protein